MALVPELEPYVLVVRGRPAETLLHRERLRPSRWQLTLTTAGMVAVVNSVVIGASAGLVVAALGDARWQSCSRPEHSSRIGASGAPEAPPARARRLRA